MGKGGAGVGKIGVSSKIIIDTRIHLLYYSKIYIKGCEEKSR